MKVDRHKVTGAILIIITVGIGLERYLPFNSLIVIGVLSLLWIGAWFDYIYEKAEVTPVSERKKRPTRTAILVSRLRK